MAKSPVSKDHRRKGRSHGDPLTGGLRLMRSSDDLRDMRRVRSGEPRPNASSEKLRHFYRPTLPLVSLGFRGFPLQSTTSFPRRQIHPVRTPIVTRKMDRPFRPDDRERVVPRIGVAVLAGGVVIEARLNVREHAVPVIHDEHRVIFRDHLDLALSRDIARRRDDPRHRDDRFRWPEQTRERGDAVYPEIKEAPPIFIVEKGRPRRTSMSITGMSGGHRGSSGP